MNSHPKTSSAGNAPIRIRHISGYVRLTDRGSVATYALALGQMKADTKPDSSPLTPRSPSAPSSAMRRALGYDLSMILSENRGTLFRIML